MSTSTNNNQKLIDLAGLGSFWTNAKTNYIDKKFGHVVYDKESKALNFYKDEFNTTNTLFTISVDDFVKDGMLSNVEKVQIVSGKFILGKPGKFKPDLTSSNVFETSYYEIVGTYNSQAESPNLNDVVRNNGAPVVISINTNAADTDNINLALKFTWNTDAGTGQTPIYFIITELGKTYTADGTTIKLTNAKFELNNAPTDKVTTSEAIVCTPEDAPITINPDNLPDGWVVDGKVSIPEDLTLNEVLTGLLCKEKWTAPVYTEPSLTANAKSPSLSVGNNGTYSTNSSSPTNVWANTDLPYTITYTAESYIKPTAEVGGYKSLKKYKNIDATGKPVDPEQSSDTGYIHTLSEQTAYYSDKSKYTVNVNIYHNSNTTAAHTYPAIGTADALPSLKLDWKPGSDDMYKTCKISGYTTVTAESFDYNTLNAVAYPSNTGKYTDTNEYNTETKTGNTTQSTGNTSSAVTRYIRPTAKVAMVRAYTSPDHWSDTNADNLFSKFKALVEDNNCNNNLTNGSSLTEDDKLVMDDGATAANDVLQKWITSSTTAIEVTTIGTPEGVTLLLVPTYFNKQEIKEGGANAISLTPITLNNSLINGINYNMYKFEGNGTSTYNIKFYHQ